MAQKRDAANLRRRAELKFRKGWMAQQLIMASSLWASFQIHPFSKFTAILNLKTPSLGTPYMIFLHFYISVSHINLLLFLCLLCVLAFNIYLLQRKRGFIGAKVHWDSVLSYSL